MVEALVVYVEPVLPFSKSEPHVISLYSLTKRGDRRFVEDTFLKALVVERTCTSRRTTAFPRRSPLLS